MIHERCKTSESDRNRFRTIRDSFDVDGSACDV